MNDRLFQTLKIGEMRLPNRLIMPTIKLGYGTKGGEVTKRHISFYVRRVQGGVGLIVTEPMYISPNGKEIPTQLGIHDDGLKKGLQELVEAVHKEGGRIMAHINHAGRAINPNLVPEGERVSASDVPCPANGVTPRPLSKEEIRSYVKLFAVAARRAKEVGFDAIEIPFSHGYLIHQFLSPHSNHRKDEYGGSFKNRLRFGREVIVAVRQQVGKGFPLIVRMNANDYVEGGLNLEDAIHLAQVLEEIGVDALSVTSGTMCESVPYCLYPMGTPKANLLPMAARIKAEVSIPVGVAGRIRTPKLARDALELGQADFIGLGRPLLADPDFPLKAREGRDEEIMLCAACHQGCLAELRKGQGTSCMFNPMVGREGGIHLSPATIPRRVMVVGGGPGGMEVAIVAAQRGHRVKLYEKESSLGGQFLLAAQVPHKEEFADCIHAMKTQMERAGVEVYLNIPVTPEFIKGEDPEIVVLATGAVPIIPPFPGLEETQWMTAYELLAGKKEVKTKMAFIVGAGTTGLETAEYLALKGIQSTVVKRRPEVGGKLDLLARSMILKRLEKLGVEVYTGWEVVRFETDPSGKTTVVARAYPPQEGAKERRFPAETVIIAMGLRPVRELAEALRGRKGVYEIGDCIEPREALDASREGFEVGLKI